MALEDKIPEISVDSYIAPNAAIIGDVFISDKSSVWYSAVVRGMNNLGSFVTHRITYELKQVMRVT